MTAVKIEKLTKKLNGNIILNDINLEIETGTVNAFFGPNGSGKTMLFRAISGLIKPTSGSIYIFGERLGDEIEFPNNIGLTIENVGFWNEYTGFENLKLLAGIRNKISDEDIKTSLERVGLKADDKRSYNKYSLGMKQKLAIAQAIMEKPDILVLDEPTNSLDSKSVEKFRKIIQEEKARGATILISSHKDTDLINLVDNYYEMEEGSLINN